MSTFYNAFKSCPSFRWKAEELSTLLPPDLQHRQNITHFPSPPWQWSSSHVGWIFTSVPSITGRADNKNLKLQCSLSTITSYQADYVTYTDGLASGGTRNGGAAAVITRGSLCSLMLSLPSKQNDKPLPSPMRKKQLPWNRHYPGHSPMPTII